jgi:hypothetical protein
MMYQPAPERFVVRTRSIAAPRSRWPSAGPARDRDLTAPLSEGEMRQAIDRARSYAILWLLMRDEMQRRVNEFEKDRTGTSDGRGP